MEIEKGGIVVRLAVLVDGAAHIVYVVYVQAIGGVFENLAANAVGVHEDGFAVLHLPNGALYGAGAYAECAIAGQEDDLPLGVGAEYAGFDVAESDVFGLSVVLYVAEGYGCALRAFEELVRLGK
jgi:hypothetical protein